MSWQTIRREGDPCSCCKPNKTHPTPVPLVVVAGALVCVECDVVARWPSVRRGPSPFGEPRSL